MALATIDDVTASRLIHHSDRGCQYCSNEYVSELKKYHVGISMTQSGDPLENAIAERANGILKVEWLYKMKIPTRNECRSILNRTSQSSSDTVNQNSDSVKTFRDKKHRL